MQREVESLLLSKNQNLIAHFIGVDVWIEMIKLYGRLFSRYIFVCGKLDHFFIKSLYILHMFRMQSGNRCMVKGQQNISFFVKLRVTHGLYYFIRLVRYHTIVYRFSFVVYACTLKRKHKMSYSIYISYNSRLAFTKNFTS